MTRILFTGGTVVTNVATLPTTDSIAVVDGRIAALGPAAIELGGNWDERIDLDGRCVVPGFRDAHAHPLYGGVEQISLNLAGITTIDGVIDAVGAWAAAHPDEAWIHGGSYLAAILPDGVGDATWLDRVCADRPVKLTSNDHHVAWVNTRALELAGITADTPDPDGGQIVRHADGSPTGTLREFGAIALVDAVAPPLDPSHQVAGLHAALDTLARCGIVWAQDALVTRDLLDAYCTAAAAGDLSCRFNLAFRAEPGRWLRQRDGFVAGRTRVESDEAVSRSITARTVKFFADGVIEAGTGFLLEPYEDAPHSCGLPNWTPEELQEAVRHFDADGFQIHIHAIGDGGIRMALDAIEHAARENGPRDRRPVIAHTQLVHPDDRPRFARLGVIANFEPLWSQLDPVMNELTRPRLGERRSSLQYPIATLAGYGARISFGSDWPVSSVNPLHGLAVAVTRQTVDGQPVGGWTPHERVPMLGAIAAYTAGSAHQAFDDADRGALTPGAHADLAVLGADITRLDGNEAGGAPVELTMLGGRTVYRAA